MTTPLSAHPLLRLINDWAEQSDAIMHSRTHAENDEAHRIASETWEQIAATVIRFVPATQRCVEGSKREHVIGADCWCGPTVEYRDPETGAAVLVHKELQ